MANETTPEVAVVSTRTALQDARVKAIYAWVNQLGRTLKTCRLYDANNPTVVRFRDELSLSLAKLLDEHGDFTLQFTSDDVTCETVSLYPSRSREDNLALPFYRDGIRSITFSPGVLPREVEALVESVLNVTGQNFGQDDLVTLLWQAQLDHVEIDYVPAEGDFGGADPESEESAVPWPQPPEEEEAETPQAAVATEEEAEAAEGGNGRSDDWSVGNDTIELEEGYALLEALAPSEVERFGREYAIEHGVSTVTTALAILRISLTSDVTPEDRGEFARFLPRMLRLSVGRGAWLEAREAAALLTEIGDDEGALRAIAQELLQPISISSAVEHLDQHEPAAVADFIAFARLLGEPAVDFLNLVLADSQQRRNRRMIAEAIANECRANPERLAPFLADRRWYVVRNVVHILAWIGGDQIAGLLQVALRHPEPRVRQEAVAALGQVSPKVARPMLLKLLEGADTRMFCAVLHQLSAERHAPTAKLLLGYLLHPAFENRAPEERRAIYTALSATAGDEVVPELAAELIKGNWFSRTQEGHRQAVARCLARIGTPGAREVLQRGAASRRGPVRQACEAALMGFNERE